MFKSIIETIDFDKLIYPVMSDLLNWFKKRLDVENALEIKWDASDLYITI